MPDPHFNIPYMVGDTYLRDHTQWPTILRSQIPDLVPGLTADDIEEEWPVDITLEQMDALSWRVRQWTFSGSGSATASNSSPFVLETISGSGIISDIDFFDLKDDPSGPDGEGACGNERELIYKVFANDTLPYKALVNNGIASPLGFVDSDWSTTSGHSGNWTGTSTFFTPRILSGFTLYDPITKLFSPNCNFKMSLIEAAILGNQLFLRAKSFRNPVTNSGHIGPALLKAPGTLSIVSGIAPDFDIPLQLEYRQLFVGLTDPISGTANGDFTLEATKFWTFENSLGQPIFDEDDGHQINPNV